MCGVASRRPPLPRVQKLIAGDRQARALELASQLHSMAALEGALKLATHHRWGLRTRARERTCVCVCVWCLGVWGGHLVG